MSSSDHEPQHGRHPTFRQYVAIAIFLFVVTLVEFFLIWPEHHLGAASVPLLIILSGVKFICVVMFYMHLRFDSRLYTWIFVGGMALAMAIGVAMIGGLFYGFGGDPRAFARERAVPYEGHDPHGPPVHTPTVTPIAPPTPTTAPGVGVDPTATPPAEGPEPTPEPDGNGPDPALIAQGQQIFAANGCGACHMLEGVPGAVGRVGPELTHIGTVGATRVPGMSAEEYIRESIEAPNAFVVQGFSPVMPPLRGSMSDAEFEALVAFLMAQE